MHTQKVAITIPEILIKEVDTLSKRVGVSRSRYIAEAVSEKIKNEKKRIITESYDNIFSDESIQEEQLNMSRNLEGAGHDGGQEW